MRTPREEVWAALCDQGLVPDESVYRPARHAVGELGGQIGRVLERIAGLRTWRRGLVRTHRRRPEDDARRVVGFGAALTGYSIAGVSLSERSRTEIVELGALANLIVTLYDTMLDAGESPGILPGWMLAVAVDSRSRAWLTPCTAVMRAPRRLLLRLVISYFARLDALPFSRVRPAIRSAIVRAIMRMYRAERSTANNEPSRVQLRRKSALPFVVMGLPAWLATYEVDEREYRRHLRWLYRLGVLFGYVDDAVDFGADQRAGRPNLFSQQRAWMAIGPRLDRLVVHVRHPYQRADTPVPSLAVREALRVSIASWFGGPANYPPSE